MTATNLWVSSELETIWEDERRSCTKECLQAIGCLFNVIYLFSYFDICHHHQSFMELGHLLTRSSLFNGLPWFLLPVGEYCFITLGNLLRGILFTWCIQFLFYSCSLSKIGVIFNSFAICVFVLWPVQVYPAVLLMYFISAAVILLVSLALMVQDSLPYNKTGRASVLYNFNLVFLRVFCGLNTLFKIPVIE